MALKQVTLHIHRLPPSLNEYLRMHWRQRNDLQQIFNDLIDLEWRKLNKVVFINPVKVVFILSFPNKRVRDFDNYLGGTKPIIDALKRTFLFRDDSEWLTGIEVRFTRGKEGAMIMIEEVCQRTDKYKLQTEGVIL